MGLIVKVGKAASLAWGWRWMEKKDRKHDKTYKKQSMKQEIHGGMEELENKAKKANKVRHVDRRTNLLPDRPTARPTDQQT